MKNSGNRKKTSTSSFGSGGRISHDSSVFYSGRLYEDVKNEGKKSSPYRENAVPAGVLDEIICGSSEKMCEIPDSSIHLMVTSPPYNVSKDYDEDLTLSEYLELLESVFRETYRVLVSGGRACINIANIGRKPYIPLHSYIVELMLGMGFLMRGEIIWNKSASAGVSTAWGSWMSPSNPCLRDVHEYILVFCKENFRRANPFNREKTINKEDFLSWTKSIWDFPTISAKKVGHPAPFPVELPYRLIQLYTFAGEVVLDPFCGSGSTCLAARRANRRYVGYDINSLYVETAKKRLADFEE